MASRTGPRQTLFNLENSNSCFAKQINASSRLKRRRVEGFLGERIINSEFFEVIVEHLEMKFIVEANNFKIQINNVLV